MKHHKIRFEDLVLFENDNYMVVNKPPYLSTLEDRHEPVNLLRIARQYISDAQVCHRLDKDTSGALAVAKNPDAYRNLSIQFEKREVSKIYHAVADGIHQFLETEVDEPILKQEDGIAKLSRREGRPALTYFTSLRPYRSHTLIECRPVTGRMHQIRVHLAFLEAPITGDEMYGGKPFFLSQVKRKFNLKKETEEQPLMKRMALHARALKFLDVSGEEVFVEAPYPKDMAVLIRQLDLNA